jgi:adenosylcobyric acid synthase
MDRKWLRRTGLDIEIAAAAGAGTPVLGICGGLQLLGNAIDDPDGVEGSGSGLGLLDVDTMYGRSKRAARMTATLPALDAPWSWLGDRTVSGYEIRLGETTARPGGRPSVAITGGLAFARGPVLGVSFHGLFEDEAVLAAFVGGVRPGRGLEEVFDQLADVVERHLDASWLLART